MVIGFMDKKVRSQATTSEQSPRKMGRKLSEYGKQLFEKQKVKEMYGLREKQFRRFFELAVRMVGAPGDNLLSLLERRLDNVVYRLKMATSRVQARQLVVHGHILVNGKKVYSPSFLVDHEDQVSLDPRILDRATFIDQVVEKRMKLSIKVPDWLELDKKNRIGRVLRRPERLDLQSPTPIEEHLIVELYSK